MHDSTYINNSSIPELLPIVCVREHVIKVKDLLEVPHKLDKVPLPPALFIPFAVVLEHIPRVDISPRLTIPTLSGMQVRKSRVLHLGAELLLSPAVPVQRLVHYHHGRAGLVQHRRHESPQARRAHEGRGSCRVAHAARARGRVAGEEPDGQAVLDDAAGHVEWQADFLGDFLVRGAAVQRHGGPEVEVVEDVEACGVGHGLVSRVGG